MAKAVKRGVTAEVLRDVLRVTADYDEAAYMLAHPGEVMPQSFIDPRDAV